MEEIIDKTYLNCLFGCGVINTLEESNIYFVLRQNVAKGQKRSVGEGLFYIILNLAKERFLEELPLKFL